VRLGHRVRDLGDQPGRAARRQRTLAGDEDVEGVTLAPLVHDVAAPARRLGVEHPEQATFLKKYDCDQMQGFLIKPPVVASEFLELMRVGAL